MRVVARFSFLVVAGLVSASLVAPPAGAAPTWRPVTNLFADLSAAGGSAQTPAVGVDAAGTATALWSRYDGTQSVVQASTRPAGGTWGAPVDVATGTSIHNPKLAIDPAGTITAVWRRRDAAGSVVQAATRPLGGAWTAPVDLSVDPSFDPSQLTDVPQVAVDAAGIVTATWSRFEANKNEPYKFTAQSATRLSDGTWTTPVDLSAPGRPARTTDVAVDPAGTATAIWVSGTVIQAATRPAGGTWAAPVDLSTIAGPRANPRIVVDPAGNATAAWGSFDGASYGVQTASLPLGGTWTAATNLSTAGGDTFDTPHLAVDRAGNATAVWQRHDGSGWVVTSATRPAGGSWTTGDDLSASGRDAWDPQVAMDLAGNATAVWSSAETRGRVVQASRRPAGGAWSEPVDLTVGGDAWNPQVAFDPAGNATTAWSRNDGTSWIVQARGLDAAGPVVTEITGAPSAGAGRVRAYSVKAHDVWSRVASARWTFADGTTATGTSVTHADGGPARVTLTDTVGNATVCTYTGTYTCRPATRVAPVITKASLTRAKIRADGSRSSAPRKTTARVVLTTDAKVTLVFRRAGTRKTVRVTERLEAGRNAVAIRAHLSRRTTLLPGRYTLTITAANKAGTSPKEKFRLRVVR
jgi:hypothetical protein